MDDETDLLVLAASAWTELMEYRYCFTYGYRKQLYEICLSFSVQDFPHLAGFQYLKDIQLPKFNPPKTVEMILSGKIKLDTVKKSSQFDNLVKPRLLALVRLKDTLENNFGLYSFTPRFYPFTTTIIAFFKNKANSRRNGTSLSSQKAKLSEKHIVSHLEEHPASSP